MINFLIENGRNVTMATVVIIENPRLVMGASLHKSVRHEQTS